MNHDICDSISKWKLILIYLITIKKIKVLFIEYSSTQISFQLSISNMLIGFKYLLVKKTTFIYNFRSNLLEFTNFNKTIIFLEFALKQLSKTCKFEKI